MNISFIRTYIVPVLAVVSIFIIWNMPSELGYFKTGIAVIIVLIASAIENGKGLFSSLGFRAFKPKKLLVITLLVASLLFIVYYFILIPLVDQFTDAPVDFSQFDHLGGNLMNSLTMLLYIWLSAAFGEEIVWRGYFMRQFVKFFGDTRLSMALNIILFAMLFGYLHSYQGITGQLIAGLIGMLLAIMFYLRKYNLWFTIAVHGFFDTFVLVALYQGWI